jgi:hypothetical protein
MILDLDYIKSQLEDIENELCKAQNSKDYSNISEKLATIQSYVSEAVCEIDQIHEEE